MGKYFSEAVFDKESQALAGKMLAAVKDSLRAKLMNKSWMDEDTKRSALRKLDKMANKIGHPDLRRVLAKLKRKQSLAP